MTDLHEKLLMMRDALMCTHTPDWFCLSVGLCGNYKGLCAELSDTSFILDEFFHESLEVACGDIWERWPLFSGNRAYPVPASAMNAPAGYPSDTTAMFAYDDTRGNMYDVNTEYGRNRRALLDYLIEQTKE